MIPRKQKSGRKELAALFALMKAKPRSADELVALSDIERKSVKLWAEAFEAEGLVKPVQVGMGKYGRPIMGWEWVK